MIPGDRWQRRCRCRKLQSKAPCVPYFALEINFLRDCRHATDTAADTTAVFDIKDSRVKAIVVISKRPQYRVVAIPKGNGKSRAIYVIGRETRDKVRLLIPHFEDLAYNLCELRVAHGFIPTRSPVTNALPHVGYRHTVSFDMIDFFDSCTLAKYQAVAGSGGLPVMPVQWAEDLLFPDGAARQGVPTSPLISNIVCAPLDKALLSVLPADAVYTRYADDMTFSCHSEESVSLLLKLVPQVVESHGFAINNKKTKVQHARAGRRKVTGVCVDDEGVHASRRVKKLLRAARFMATVRHDDKHFRLRYLGLKGWAELGTGIGRKARHQMRRTEDTVQKLGIAAQYARFKP